MQRAKGEMNKDTGNHEENASQHRQPCIPLGDFLTAVRIKARLVQVIRHAVDLRVHSPLKRSAVIWIGVSSRYMRYGDWGGNVAPLRWHLPTFYR